MNRHLRISLWFIGLFVGADAVRATLQRSLLLAYLSRDSGWNQWLPRTELAMLAVYFVVFGIAGAAIARVAQRSSLGICLSIALGAAAPLSSLLFESPHPWIVRDHGSTPWLIAMSWAHWYMPPVACAIGALVWQRLSGRHARGENAA